MGNSVTLAINIGDQSKYHVKLMILGLRRVVRENGAF